MWGFRRMKAKAIARVAACAQVAQVHVTTEGKDRVLWSEEQAEQEHRGARVHDRDGDGLRREIGDISRAELAELLRFWIDNAGPRSADELFEHANQSLGDLKLGQKLRERLQAGLQVAVCRGILEPSTSVVRRTHDRSHPQSP